MRVFSCAVTVGSHGVVVAIVVVWVSRAFFAGVAHKRDVHGLRLQAVLCLTEQCHVVREVVAVVVKSSDMVVLCLSEPLLRRMSSANLRLETFASRS